MKRKRDKRSQPANAAHREARRNEMIAFQHRAWWRAGTEARAQSAEVRAGIVPYAELQRLIDEFHAGWISDLGGAENLTRAPGKRSGSKQEALGILRNGHEIPRKEWLGRRTRQGCSCRGHLSDLRKLAQASLDGCWPGSPRSIRLQGVGNASSRNRGCRALGSGDSFGFRKWRPE